MSSRPHKHWPAAAITRWIVLGLAGLLALTYFARALWYLCLDPNGANDLCIRWQEMSLYWHNHVFPHTGSADYNLSRWDSTGYLPIAFWIGLPWVPPLESFQATRLWLGLTQVIAWPLLILLLARQHRIDRLFALCVLGACSASCTSIALGQYTIPGMVLSALCLEAERKHRPILAIALAVGSLLKPQLSLPWFVSRMWRRSATAWLAGLCAVAILAGCFFATGDFLEHVHHYANTTTGQADRGYGLGTLLALTGLPVPATYALELLLAVALSLLAAHYIRDEAILLALGFFIARLYFPAYVYDNVLLVPLLAAMLRDHGKPGWRGWLWLPLALTLWLPARLTDYAVVQITQWIVWLISASIIAASAARPTASPTTT